ncbi:MAG: M15 family metallopeptidase [Cyanobacteria bacterium J06592_8]
MNRKFTLFFTVLFAILGYCLTTFFLTHLPVNLESATAGGFIQTPANTPFIKDYSQVKSRNRLVDIQDINPNIRLDIRYATANNFLDQKLYPVPRCLLRVDVAQSLSKVQENLEKMGLGLKVFDCYRPWSVSQKMWEILPDSRYVANPQRGSRHNRGAAVDLTLVDLRTGNELEMPTDFDDFTEKAARDYTGNSPQVRRNSNLLEFKMKQYGFTSLITEWWHFDAADWEKYALLNVNLDRVP